MNTSARFVFDIVTKLLNKPLSSNEYYKVGGSKNIFRRCVERNKGIGATCAEALINLIIKEIKYNELKKKFDFRLFKTIFDIRRKIVFFPKPK